MRDDRAVSRDLPDDLLDLAFTGDVVEWRGPSPFVFVAMPSEPSAAVRAISGMVSYGWGCIPVTVRLGDQVFTTALIPKDGRYLVPLRAAVRRTAGVAEGDSVALRLTIRGG